MNKAIFLDRDGTINEEMGYINHISRFSIFPFTFDAIRIFNELGYLVIVVTNQAGIARGYFKEDLVIEIHKRLNEEAGKKNAVIDSVYYCPHHPQSEIEKYRMNCDCRKPKPGMINQACREYEIDLQKSYMVGDRQKDIQFGARQGLKTGFVLTGYGRGEYEYQKDEWQTKPDLIGKNVLDIARQIEKHEKKTIHSIR